MMTDGLWMLFAIIAVIALVAGILSIPRPRKVPLSDSDAATSRRVTANPEFFIDHRIDKIQKQMAFTDTRLAQEDQIAHADRRQKEKVATERVLHEGLIDTHQTQMAQNDLTRTIIGYAKVNKMDTPAYNEVRVAQETSKIKVRENWELEQNRIVAYEAEVQTDMQAALGMHMMEVEKLDYISGKIALLKSQNADSERIETLVTIREQMARRLLQAGDGQQLEGTDKAPEGGENS